jgi:hypothetical protein
MSLLRSLLIVISCLAFSSNAQDRWQQRVEYDMNVSLDASTHIIKGTQKLNYYNNSKDTLTKVYYHLFLNAFQPGSMMDVRSRTISDPDPRVTDRISKLNEKEIGFQHVLSLKQDGKDVSYTVNGTILEVILPKAILPSSKTVFDLTFEAQVPVQIRRTGRDNKEGIAYSMTQWYPKIAEYDFRGWNAYQYVAREFHGVWGDFDVKITLDPKYVVAATGKLQNADKIGYGYEKTGSVVKRPDGNLTWHFIAKNVHDFAWTADPEYTHEKIQVPDGPELHFFYQPGEKTTENWKKVIDAGVKHFQFMNVTFGKYPYDTYSVIQGGDGGMEYPMCTLITGERTFPSLLGVMAHEVSHSWYQGVLASNETLHPWLDEGFADFSSDESLAHVLGKSNAHETTYTGYSTLVKSGNQEPASLMGDVYNVNRTYTTISYNMGAMLLNQLKYIMGADAFYKGMRRYYNTYKFKHPEPFDFIRVMEKVSGLQLNWFMIYWINSTKKIDYTVKNVVLNGNETLVTLERLGDLPMPIDLVVTFKDGSKELYYVPLNETLGNKQVEDKSMTRYDLQAWRWVNPTYTLKLSKPAAEVQRIEIDPSMRLADVNRTNNIYDASSDIKPYQDPTK